MYEVIKTGGKQYSIVSGENFKIEQIPAELNSQIILDQVLLIADKDKVTIGAPFIKGAAVKATVIRHGKHDKVRIFKMRRRKHYQKRQGHRQNFTEIRIDSIQ